MPASPNRKEFAMTRTNRLGIVAAALVATLATDGFAARAAAQARAATEAAAAAAKASPDLIGALSKEIGATEAQAAGAAGALFGAAKSRLKPDEFSQIAKAVPGMDLLLGAAPAAGVGTAGALSQLAGSAGGLGGVASAFSQLGLKPELVAKAVPVLTSFVTKSGGANVGNLLASVLK
jgi:hypothetical protein